MSSQSVEEIFGIHASRAALKNPRRKVYSIVCTQDFYDNHSYDLKKKNIEKIQILKRKQIDSLLGFNTHQGVFLKCNFLQNYKIADIKNNEEIVIMLDSLNDSQNIGSIIRSAVAFKIDGIIVKERSFPSKSKLLYKSASGGTEHIKIFKVSNLNTALKFLKTKEFWISAFDVSGTKDFTKNN